jgi:N6-L-threonylcarbamoyladenine synthase
VITLGIESSCDETACGIVNEKREVLANVLYSQFDEHKDYGGVVPEIAARAHLEKISPIVSSALKKAKIKLSDIDLIAYTRGPGLMGPLLVGASFARGLAKDLNIPVAGISHLEGHIAAAEMSFPDLKPPYVALTVSGGHTELTLVKENFSYELLGRTRDDAAGEAFDKCGKLLGLGYPAGPIIGKIAAGGNRKFHRFPRSFKGTNVCEFSFSGLKTSVLRYVQEHDENFLGTNIKDICASVETAIVDILIDKSKLALKQTKIDKLVICGGVSANRYLREQMKKQTQFKSYFPDFSLCTDNGAMIAGAAQNRFNQNMLDLSLHEVTPSLPLAQ